MLIICAILFPMIAGPAVSLAVPGEKKRNLLYVLVMGMTDILCVLAILFSKRCSLFAFADNVQLVFLLDGVGKYFLFAVIILYTAVLFYSFEYIKMEKKQNLFFAFYFLSLGTLIAVCAAGNLVTMYMSFEMMTLMTVPLVLHERSKEAVAAGLKYLFYSIGGAMMGLFAVFFVCFYSGGAKDFVFGGTLDPYLTAGHEALILAAIFVGIMGFGTKCGLYPMHGWLPSAHPIAPAPASAILSGIVVKGGVISVLRLVYFAAGAETIRGTWVQTVWMSLCCLTIFMGSMMAYREKVVKKRLAYSTVSQISYILLGLSCLTVQGVQGGLLHVMSHMASKGCLFLCAGVFIYRLGIRRVADLKGIGKRMPVTLGCFTVAALSLVGIPPLGGFTSKWVIASALIDAAPSPFLYLGPVVLLVSALLTAGYLLQIVVDGFFPGFIPSGESENTPIAMKETTSAEPSKLMTLPLIFLCAVALIMGIFGTQITAFVLTPGA